MTARTINNLAELSKEEIASLYFQSLANVETRKTHVWLQRTALNTGGPAPVPSVHDFEMDCQAWYGGMISLARAFDPGTEFLPPKEVSGYITQNFEKARTALAA